jgi:hypothetical protein
MPNLIAWVSNLALWRRTSAPEQTTGDEAVTVGPEDVRATTWDSDIDLSLGKLVTDTQTKASGRVQVLTLAHLRSQLGDGWDRYQRRVVMIAETTIGRMIGKGNLFLAQDEDSWLLLMPALTEHEAERKADEIARVLGEKLMGERFEEKEPPLPQTAKVDLSATINADGSFNIAAMKTAVKRARIVLAATDARRASKELDKNKAKTEAANRAFATTASFAQASLFPMLTVVYRPQWVAETESYASFVMRAFTDTGEPVFGPSAPTAVQASLNDATIIDLAKAAFGDFTAMTQKGHRATFVLPVPFVVMTRKLGAVFMRALAALPQKERLMHMRVELVNIPLNANVQTMIDVRELFRGRVKDVAFLMDLEALNDSVLALDHIVIGVEVKTDSALSDADLSHALIALRRRAGARRTYAMGLRSRAHALLAIQAGIEEISGTGMADDMNHLPDRITVVYKQDLVRGG